jgi:hypothetical protein
MAEKKKESAVEEKTTTQKTETAPIKDKSVEQKTEPVDVEEIVDEALMILNIMDKEVGGKGEIAAIPEDMRNSLKSIIDLLNFVKGRYEDPLYSAIMDDMKDQEEDGKTPSLEVAIARNIPLERIQALAEGEDYEGTQNELSSNLTAKKQSEEEEVEYEASFEESKKAGEEYAAKMGYDETEKNDLFQVVLDLFKILADGKITVEEFEKVDKMRNYDKDMADVIGQIPSNDAKEVLPDKASVDASNMKTQQKPKTTPTPTGPGLTSMGVYDKVGIDVTEVGKRKRK